MTDTQTTGAAAQVPQEKKTPRLYRLRVAFGMLPEPTGRPSFLWLERWDAFIVGALVAVGVPLLGLSGFGLETKKTILIGWFASWLVFFVAFEGRELIGQMTGRGSIKPQQLSDQQNTAQDPFYGCIIAVAIWAVVLAVHVTVKVYPVADANVWRLLFVQIPLGVWDGLSMSPVHFGVIEWSVLVHVWLCTSIVNHIFYNTGNIFSKAAPMGERVERRVGPNG